MAPLSPNAKDLGPLADVPLAYARRVSPIVSLDAGVYPSGAEATMRISHVGVHILSLR